MKQWKQKLSCDNRKYYLFSKTNYLTFNLKIIIE